jgi:Co/Zn/Cd efflux system component
MSDSEEKSRKQLAMEKLTEKSNDNLLVLQLTCLFFAVFCAAEIFGALASHSLSLLGDGTAMSVDV